MPETTDKETPKTFVSYSQILLLHLCKSIGCFQKKVVIFLRLSHVKIKSISVLSATV